jgi:hypothetical protein
MADPSTSHRAKELEQIQVLNEVLDNENIGEYNSDNDSVYDCVYIQLVPLRTHMISNSEMMNKDNINLRLGGVSKKFVWQNTG